MSAGPGLRVASVCFLRLSSSQQQITMKSVSAALLLVPVLLVLPALTAPGCGPCEPALCSPLPPEGCKSGSVLDSCGCCSVCAAAEGEACGGRRAGARRCGPGLECVKSNTDKKNKQGVCACKSDYEVCGSDGVTYRNGCGLRSASLAAEAQGEPPVTIQNKGRCTTGESAPPRKDGHMTEPRAFTFTGEIFCASKRLNQNKKSTFWGFFLLKSSRNFAAAPWELLPAESTKASARSHKCACV